MVYFITGPVGSGKSTRLFDIYKSIHSGDGFYNFRLFSNGKTIGQDIIQLSTGVSIPFSRIKGTIPYDWDEEVRYMDYSFSGEGLRFVENIVEKILQNNLKTAFIDELGQLEIRKEGLYNHFKKLLQREIDLYTVCRDSCIHNMIDLFSIENYIIMKDNI